MCFYSVAPYSFASFNILYFVYSIFCKIGQGNENVIFSGRKLEQQQNWIVLNLNCVKMYTLSLYALMITTKGIIHEISWFYRDSGGWIMVRYFVDIVSGKMYDDDGDGI